VGAFAPLIVGNHPVKNRQLDIPFLQNFVLIL
jgi:hypothetical protein